MTLNDSCLVQGVPAEAIKLKMRAEGLDPNLLESDYVYVFFLAET